jgi:hypothetical protein
VIRLFERDGFTAVQQSLTCRSLSDTEHHLIVTHEVTNTGLDRSQLAKVASQAKDILGADHLDAVADRGYFNSPEILACEQAYLTVTLPNRTRAADHAMGTRARARSGAAAS